MNIGLKCLLFCHQGSIIVRANVWYGINDAEFGGIETGIFPIIEKGIYIKARLWPCFNRRSVWLLFTSKKPESKGEIEHLYETFY
ncbi:hypothetical protein JOC78_002772 [Bacillus ectoiniformans]|nr:hypothetical protein [Bacillus ectoiniformans]